MHVAGRKSFNTTCAHLAHVLVASIEKMKPGKEREGTEETTSGRHEGKEAINKTQRIAADSFTGAA